jgi:hypothetical protein
MKVVASKSNPPEVQVREAWLLALAVEFMREIEDRCGLTFPPVRVTCGFPSKGGEMGRSTRVRGQCWSAEASEDRHAEIFISPVEAEAETVAAILAHELVHAALPDAGHGKTFSKAMKALGHVKPFTTATPTDDFWEWVRPLLADAGPYPHAMLVAMRPVAAPKKQANRMIKLCCPDCGYTVRTARKWIVEVGLPICPKDMVKMTGEGLDGEDPDELEEEAA